MDLQFIAFDLETAKVQSPHSRNWIEQRPLGICCAATYCEGAKAPLVWYGGKRQNRPAPQMTPSEASVLVQYLRQRVLRGYTIVTWNGVGFDFDILAEESGL